MIDPIELECCDVVITVVGETVGRLALPPGASAPHCVSRYLLNLRVQACWALSSFSFASSFAQKYETVDQTKAVWTVRYGHCTACTAWAVAGAAEEEEEEGERAASAARHGLSLVRIRIPTPILTHAIDRRLRAGVITGC